ncbi:protein kinase domain-containing protein [Schlesneria paludicola]|uniref:protein kinase domain-containing protein n=1 Tax=Schlesneria paludicola TaxID=360056 RepID=UPI00029B3E6B|nr:redoxin domain-containing protein [Schlesneria paludicola]
MAISNLISSWAPDFTLPGVKNPLLPVETLSLSDYRGSWLLLIFYPRNFSFVCPTELTSFSSRSHDFQQRNCQLLALSVDPIESHVEWLRTAPADGGLGSLEFPLASDSDGVVAREYGVWSQAEGVSHRGTFIIDPDGVVQYSVVHNLSVGRSVDETLRVLDALQSGGLCPASWTRADGNLDLENALKPGRVLGQYRLIESRGDGAFGHVFAAWDSRLERSVALKVFKRQTRQSRQDILGEARAAAPLMHPNICTIYAVDEIDGLLVIAMELLHGQSLAEFLKKPSPLVVRLRIAEGIAAGLVAAHAKQIVHGDLKPDNIHVGEDSMARILDFGLARKRESLLIAVSQQTTSGSVPSFTDHPIGPLDETVRMPKEIVSENDEGGGISGTPAYMAPERWSDRAVAPANDIYAFGLILYELTTGQRALKQTDLTKLLKAIQDPGLPARLSSEMPPELGSLCAIMLAHEPEQRPTAVEIGKQLQSISVAYDQENT